MIKADKEGQRKAPILRFKGFTDAWEQRKLLSNIENIIDYRGKTPKKLGLSWNGEREYPALSAINVENGKINLSKTEHFGDAYLFSKWMKKALKLGQVILTTEAPVGNVAQINEKKHYILSQRVIAFETDKNLLDDFLYFLLQRNNSTLLRYSTGGTAKGISQKSLKQVKVNLTPNISEQKQISLLLNVVKNLITLYERKLKLLSQVKKYFLDNLFTEKEYPNLRFKGFTDAWEQRKLGQVGKTQSGVGFPNEEQGGLEGIPFFKVSDMNNPGNEYEMVNANNYVKDDQLARKKWHPIKSVPAVIFAKVGAAIMLNRKRLVTRPFLIDNNSMAYIFDDSWDINFGKNIFETINLPRYAQVGALPSYNGSDIQGIKIFLPRKNEQSKIGIFIMTINEIITLYENKQQHLTKIKKTLLNTMFI